MHYYEDTPGRQGESEAISIDRLDDTYYRPFSNRPLIFEAKAAYNCEDLQSPFVCQASKLCGWDGSIHGCYYISANALNEIRFKENLKNLNKMKKIKHKRKHLHKNIY